MPVIAIEKIKPLSLKVDFHSSNFPRNGKLSVFHMQIEKIAGHQCGTNRKEKSESLIQVKLFLCVFMCSILETNQRSQIQYNPGKSDTV